MAHGSITGSAGLAVARALRARCTAAMIAPGHIVPVTAATRAPER